MRKLVSLFLVLAVFGCQKLTSQKTVSVEYIIAYKYYKPAGLIEYLEFGKTDFLYDIGGYYCILEPTMENRLNGYSARGMFYPKEIWDKLNMGDKILIEEKR